MGAIDYGIISIRHLNSKIKLATSREHVIRHKTFIIIWIFGATITQYHFIAITTATILEASRTEYCSSYIILPLLYTRL